MLDNTPSGWTDLRTLVTCVRAGVHSRELAGWNFDALANRIEVYLQAFSLAHVVDLVEEAVALIGPAHGVEIPQLDQQREGVFERNGP